MKKRMFSLMLMIVFVFGCVSYNTAEIKAGTSISVGEYVIMGSYLGEKILWRCVDIDDNGPLMLSDKILCIKPFDAKGSDSDASHGRGYYANRTQGGNRQSYGSNYWGDSNIRDWLNSSASASNVVWSCGNPPDSSHCKNNAYSDEAGFLNGFTPAERSAIKTVTQKSILDAYEYSSGSKNSADSNYHKLNTSITSVVTNYDTALSENIKDKVFLLDVKQLYNVYANLGDYWYQAVCTKAAVAESDEAQNSDKYISTSNYGYYWLRTPFTYITGYSGNSSASYKVRAVTPDGKIDSLEAYNRGMHWGVCGVRPAFYINTDNAVFSSGSGTSSNPYVLTGNGTEDTNSYYYNKFSANISSSSSSSDGSSSNSNSSDSSGGTKLCYACINGKIVCASCHGSGMSTAGSRQCVACGGKGYIVCAVCHGTGVISN